MTHKYFWWVIYIFFGQLDELNNISPKNAYPKIFRPKVISKSLYKLSYKNVIYMTFALNLISEYFYQVNIPLKYESTTMGTSAINEKKFSCFDKVF